MNENHSVWFVRLCVRDTEGVEVNIVGWLEPWMIDWMNELSSGQRFLEVKHVGDSTDVLKSQIAIKTVLDALHELFQICCSPREWWIRSGWTRHIFYQSPINHFLLGHHPPPTGSFTVQVILDRHAWFADQSPLIAHYFAIKIVLLNQYFQWFAWGPS